MAVLIETAPGCVRTPFTILIDKAEKAPWTFAGIRARSFVDKEMRVYHPQIDRRYLGIGMGDYTLEGFEGRVGIERKSMADFQATLLGWPVDAESAAAEGKVREVNRRGRFKSELRKLAAMECRAVIVEATLGECIDECVQWGVYTADQNRKLLYSTFLAWSQQFRVPWYFLRDKEEAAQTAFRIMEKFWSHHKKEAKKVAL